MGRRALFGDDKNKTISDKLGNTRTASAALLAERGANRQEDRNLSDLDPRFTRFYESGERVEVTWKPGYEDYSGYGARTDGRKARFYVGRSTGRKPIYLQLDNRRSTGGGAILSSAVESVRGLGEYRYGRAR